MPSLAKLTDAEYLIHLCLAPAPLPVTQAADKTRDQARQHLDRLGLSVAKWARQNNVSQAMTYEVLQGRKQGKWGEAHRVAVLLGIKDGIA